MTVRIAMWSGPRNISTAMMRSWENRPDCSVVDEPFYACYLAETGLDHPCRDAILASQSASRETVVEELTRGRVETPLQYQKELRLLEARRLLTTGGASVTAAAYEVGYESPSQFSREYSRLFGAPPLRDIRQLSGAPAGR